MVTKIRVNGSWFAINCEINTEIIPPDFEGDVIALTLGIPKEGDGIMYAQEYDEGSDLSWTSSIRLSEIKTAARPAGGLGRGPARCEGEEPARAGDRASRGEA